MDRGGWSRGGLVFLLAPTCTFNWIMVPSLGLGSSWCHQSTYWRGACRLNNIKYDSLDFKQMVQERLNQNTIAANAMFCKKHNFSIWNESQDLWTLYPIFISSQRDLEGYPTTMEKSCKNRECESNLVPIVWTCLMMISGAVTCRNPWLDTGTFVSCIKPLWSPNEGS